MTTEAVGTVQMVLISIVLSTTSSPMVSSNGVSQTRLKSRISEAAPDRFGVAFLLPQPHDDIVSLNTKIN